MSFFGLRFTHIDEDERAQKNTFTKWMNYHLEEHSSSGRVNDLYEDIKDGVLLCHLIEVLTGEALPVNKARVSKRVHHIANLTTALAVLRRRGLELINNNPVDIADGNPRIVLGLIWQIILHFQIEANVALLREWGWGATASVQASTSRPVTPCSPSTSNIPSRPATPSRSPFKQRLASLLPSSSSSHTPSNKDPLRVSMKQFKSSVEQVMIRWINSEVASKIGEKVENMDKAWKDGVLFNALVHRWRPDVVDMKRVRQSQPRENLENAFEMAHRHLGIRKLLEVDDVLCEKPDKRSIITYVSQFVHTFGERKPMEDEQPETHSKFIEWLNVTSIMDLRYEQQQVYFRVRKEFVEYRSLYNAIMSSRMNFTVQELTDIERKWDCIRAQLEAAIIRIENSLPEPFASLSQWTADSQVLITQPLDLSTEDPAKCVLQLQKLMTEHTNHFLALESNRDELRSAIEKGGLGGKPLAPEFVEPLRVRLNTLAEEAPIRLATIRILLSHYVILSYLMDIDRKMDQWSCADSIALLSRWIKEYQQVHAENPRARCDKYLEHLRKTMEVSPETKLDSNTLLQSSSKRISATLDKFDSLHSELLTLKTLWCQWEDEIVRLEALADEGVLNNTNTLSDFSTDICSLESTADGLAPMLSTSARIAVQHRMDKLRKKALQLSRLSVGARLVVDIVPSTSQNIEKPNITNLAELDEEVLKLEMVLRAKLHPGPHELQEGFGRLQTNKRLNSLKGIRPRLVAIEEYMEQAKQWLNSSEDYERGKATDVLDQLQKMVESLQNGNEAEFVDCRQYIFSIEKLYSLMNNVPQSSSSYVSSINPPADKEHVKQVISRMKEIIRRREKNEDDVRTSTQDMEECSIIVQDWNSRRLEEIRRIWKLKKQEFNEWESLMERLMQIIVNVEKAQFVDSKTLSELRAMEVLSKKFTYTDLGETSKNALFDFRNRLIVLLEERLNGIRMVGEDDCSVAHSLVKEVGEELVLYCNQLNDRYEYTRQTLDSKMELFKRLQNFYDAVRSLRSQNNHWNVITLAEVPSVCSELEVLIERCTTEWKNDAEKLRAEVVAIQGSFFQLEFDRVNEKLNMLMVELNKLHSLMLRRQEFLTITTEFIQFTDSSLDVSQHATSSEQSTDMQGIVTDICARLEEKARCLRDLSENAEMTITDFSAGAIIRHFRKRQLGEEAEPSFDLLAQKLEELIGKKLVVTENTNDCIANILQLKEIAENEEKLIEEMKDVQKTEKEENRFKVLYAGFMKHREQREKDTVHLILQYLEYLNLKFREYEDDIGNMIDHSLTEELGIVNESLWNQWKNDVTDFEKIVGQSNRNKFRPEFTDLQRKLVSLDSRIAQHLNQSSKLKKQSEKLAKKISLFQVWLDTMERDICTVEQISSETERVTQLTHLYRICLSYQRLVHHLERITFQNNDHIIQLIQRYNQLLNKLRSYDLPEAEGIPLHVPSAVQGFSQSQISISSLASSENERPESVMSVTSSLDEPTHPQDVIRKKVSRLLRNMMESYSFGAKPLSIVEEDLLQLRELEKEVTGAISVLLQGDGEPVNEGVKHRLLFLNQQIKDFSHKLEKEVEDEKGLSAKQTEIMDELTKLEDRVKNRANIDFTNELDHLEMQMDMLKVISNQPRQYVECEFIDSSSRESSPSERSKRRKKVLVMVTNTVTTIIQVVEERMLTIESSVQPPAIQEKIRNVKHNLKLLDKESITLSEEQPELSSIENSAVLNEIEHIRENIAKASEIGCDDTSSPLDLATAADSLKETENRLDILRNELENCEDNSNLDAVSAVVEELNAVQASIDDRLDEEHDTPQDLLEAESLISRQDEVVQQLQQLLEESDSLDREISSNVENLEAEYPIMNSENVSIKLDEIRTVLERTEIESESTEKTKEALCEALNTISEQQNELYLLKDVVHIMNDIDLLDKISEIDEYGRCIHESINDQIASIAEHSPQPNIEEIKQIITEISDSISRASQIPEETKTSEAIREVLDDLAYKEPLLFKLKDILDNMNTTDQHVKEIQTELIDNVSNIEEEWRAVQMSLQDKLDSVDQFNSASAELKTELLGIQNTIPNMTSEMHESTVIQIENLFEKLNDLQETAKDCVASEDYLDRAEELRKQLIEVNQTLNASIERTNALDEMLTTIENVKNLIDQPENQDFSLEKYDILIEELPVDRRNELRHKLDEAKDAKKKHEEANNVPKLAEKLAAIGDVLPAELDEQKKKLVDRIHNINANADAKLDEAVRAQEKLEDVTAKLDKDKEDVELILKKLTEPQSIDKIDEELTKLQQIIGSIDTNDLEKTTPQLARTANDIKEQAKKLASPLEKVLPQEHKLREDNKNLNNQVKQLADALANINVADSERAVPVIDNLKEQIDQLAKDIESHENDLNNKNKDLVKDDDLAQNLNTQVVALVDEAAQKQAALADTVKINKIAPELEVIAQSINSRPEKLPETLVEQQASLEDLESSKARLEALISELPEGPEGDEQRQKSQWDLSRLKDLLKQLGDLVGDKMAALAAFNSSRKDAEDNLLAITSKYTEEPKDLPEEQLLQAIAKDREVLDKLHENVANIDVAILDDAQKKEHDELLNRLSKAQELLEKRQAALEDRQQKQKDLEELHKKTIPAQSRLASLVNAANDLVQDAQGVPSQYRPSADELAQEVEVAKNVVANAPSDEPTVQALQQAIDAAHQIIPILQDRANTWDEFVDARNDTDAELERLRQPLDAALEKAVRSIDDAKDDLQKLSEANKSADILADKIRNLQRLSELLNPLECTFTDVRFIDVDAEQTNKQYDEILDELANEIEEEKSLNDFIEHIEKELQQINQLLSTNPAAEVIDSLEIHEIPAIRSQIDILKNKKEELQAGNKHIKPDQSNKVPALCEQVPDLDGRLQEAKAVQKQAEQEEVAQLLIAQVTQLTQKPLDQLSEEDVADVERNLEKLPETQQTELRHKLDEAKDAKKKHEEAVKQAQKELADVTEQFGSLTATPAPSKKSKKGKGKKSDKPEEETVAVLQDKLNRIKELSDKLSSLSEAPLPSSERQKVDELLNNLKQLADATSEDLAKKIAEEQELNRLLDALKNLEDELKNAEQTVPALNNVEQLSDFKKNNVPKLAEKLAAIDRANTWDEFVELREVLQDKIELVLLKLDESNQRELLSTEDGESYLDSMKALINSNEEINRLSETLEDIVYKLSPLLIVEQEKRFLDVDVESNGRRLEELLQKLSNELSEELELNRTLSILTTELDQCRDDLSVEDNDHNNRMSRESLLNDIIAHLENQIVIVQRSTNRRQFIRSSTSAELERLLARAHELLESLRNIPDSSEDVEEREYDVDAAANVLAALYPNEHPYNVLQQHGIEGIPSEADSSEMSTEDSSEGRFSPMPEDEALANPHLRRQRSRWRRVLRTALPLQAMLVLLLGAACLVPHCDDEYCCQLLNNFARSFDPSIEFVNGPPPF
ncbi:unnamed protein product [Auanema sp. JU1783]|nr:unnamed protein product [Auanema sp. JU1783]